MKFFALLFFALGSSTLQAKLMSQQEMLALVHQVTLFQNQAMLPQSSKADVDALFQLYSPDFTYVHDKHGGVYSREHLYRNINTAITKQLFKDTEPRYVIETIVLGENAAAVRRLEQTGVKGLHLAVFEFSEGRVKRITEYW